MPDSLVVAAGNGLLPPELAAPFGMLLPFLVTAARIGGLFAFISVPGLRAAFEPMRAALVVLITVILFPFTPTAAIAHPTLPGAALLALSEAVLGVVFGLAVQVLHEGVLLGAQLLSVQAGYSYASTVDPNSEADSNVIQVFLTLANSLLFVVLGLDRVLIRLLAQSLISIPPGTMAVRAADGEALIRLTADIFTVGLRTAAPLVGLLLLLDIVMALLSRLQPQLQLLQLSFPVKMLACLATLALIVGGLPAALESNADQTFTFLQTVVARGGR